jgi:flavin reductase (DIM6/NTAB) family NADH-FMN oxidoreductase RutF
MTPRDPLSVCEKALRTIRDGAFLTVKAGADLNVMTIGWALIGVIWSRNVLTVAVRNSRHTYGIIERAADFTVSVPARPVKEALSLCGTKSGRDTDKFKAAGLAAAGAFKVNSPIIKIPGIHFECAIVHKTPMNPAQAGGTLAPLYPKKDYHTMYYGEIVQCYEME